MKRIRIMALLAAVGAFQGCTAARMSVPPQLVATTQPVQLSGMGFGQRGSFTLGSSSGAFTRHALSASDSRPFIADGVTSFFGDGSFSVQGPDFDGRVEASCRYLEAEVDEGPATVTAIPFRYRCLFSRDGRPIEGRLELHAAPRPVGPLMAETRSGRFEIEGRSFAILPVHHSPQLAIPTADPLGYRFVRDGSDVGAIDINGERKTIYTPASGPDRESILMASLALSVLWKD